jgi:hypothetical protein
LRIAALVFGVLAGLVASLILALGGLDPSLAAGADPRYFAFGLSVIASLAIFAAGVALAAPLAGMILMILAAAAWAGAAVVLHHGPDLQLITPPALLLVGAIFGLIAVFRRPAPRVLPALDLDLSDPTPEPAPTAAAMFDAEPEPQPEPVPELEPLALPEIESTPAVESLPSAFEGEDMRAAPDQRWRPGKRRPPPPRQEPVFREPELEDDEEYESGFSRFARGVSGLLSFGLYAALAAAAVVVYFNVRTAEAVKPVQVAEVKAVSSSEPPPSSSSSLPPPSSSSSSSSLAPIVVAPSSAPAESDEDAARMRMMVGDAASAAPGETLLNPGAGVVFGAPDVAASSASFADSSSASLDASAFESASSSEVPVQLQPENLLSAEASSSSVEPPVETAALPPGFVMPFTMPAAMAAARARPSPGPTTVAPAASQPDTTGL